MILEPVALQYEFKNTEAFADTSPLGFRIHLPDHSQSLNTPPTRQRPAWRLSSDLHIIFEDNTINLPQTW